jgi:sugar/nucleoside kinase (ribokinase family)
MDLLIVGSIAFDNIKTPFGKVNKILGGSAIYSSIAASNFVRPTIVGVVGEDFEKKYFDLLKKHNIDVSHIKIEKGKTFHWEGYYDYDLNIAHTVDTQLNVFSKFNPQLSSEAKNVKFVFLGNIDPVLQLSVYQQVKNPKIVACDTMNYWIEKKFIQLKKLLKKIDILFINKAEIRQLTKEYNVIKSARKVLSWGTKIVIVKRGEYGVMCFYKNKIFVLPAYPLEKVFDPTGAGDSFAGGVMGFLAYKLKNNNVLTEQILRQSIVFGTVTASFCVEDFGIKKLYKTTYKDILQRYREIKHLVHFEMI